MKFLNILIIFFVVASATFAVGNDMDDEYFSGIANEMETRLEGVDDFMLTLWGRLDRDLGLDPDVNAIIEVETPRNNVFWGAPAVHSMLRDTYQAVPTPIDPSAEECIARLFTAQELYCFLLLYLVFGMSVYLG